MNDQERLPLFSIEAEMSVLSAAMSNKETAVEVCGELTGKEFTRPAHKVIFEAMQANVQLSVDVDLTTLRDRLSQSKKLESAGGVTYLAEVSGFAPNIDSVLDYIHIVQDRYKLRLLESTAQQIISIVHNPDVSTADEKVDMALDELAQISTRKEQSEFANVKTIVKGIFTGIDEAIERGEDTPLGNPTGYPELDKKLGGGGFRKGSLIILGSRPAMGKTSLMMNIAVRQARIGVGQTIFSLEMSKEDVVRREMASVGGFPVKFTEGIQLNESDYLRVSDAAEAIQGLPIDIRDTDETFKVSWIRTTLARVKRERGSVGTVWVDYVQMIEEDTKSSSDKRNYQIERIARYLKNLAKKFECTIILLAQVSRACESRDNKRPMMADLSDSSGLEKYADAILMLFRQEYYDAKDDSREQSELHLAEIIIRKSRFGSEGTVRAAFQPAYTRFLEEK